MGCECNAESTRQSDKFTYCKLTLTHCALCLADRLCKIDVGIHRARWTSITDTPTVSHLDYRNPHSLCCPTQSHFDPSQAQFIDSHSERTGIGRWADAMNKDGQTRFLARGRTSLSCEWRSAGGHCLSAFCMPSRHRNAASPIVWHVFGCFNAWHKL